MSRARKRSKKWRCWSRYAASREDPLRAVIPPPRGPASFPCSVNQPEAVRRSSSTLKPSPPRGPQCRVSFWNGAAAFGVSLNPRSSTHATNPSTHMPRKHGHSPLLRRAGKLRSEGTAILRCAHPQGPRHYGTCNSAHINCWVTSSNWGLIEVDVGVLLQVAVIEPERCREQARWPSRRIC